MYVHTNKHSHASVCLSEWASAPVCVCVSVHVACAQNVKHKFAKNAAAILAPLATAATFTVWQPKYIYYVYVNKYL